jgi:hypothetical protein
MAKRSSSRARPRVAVRREAPAPPSRPDTAGLYATLLSDLNSTIVRMTSPRFDALLQRGSAEDRLRAMREILSVERARLVLGNAVLQDIAAKLKENEPALIEGRENLEEALDRLENIAKVLNTVSRFLEVIGKVVALV